MEMSWMEKAWRLFGKAGLMMLVALLGMATLSHLPPEYAGATFDLLTLPLLGALAWGTGWWILNAWRLYCWESGNWDGPCLFCGGHMHVADGVSLCLDCSTRHEALAR